MLIQPISKRPNPEGLAMSRQHYVEPTATEPTPEERCLTRFRQRCAEAEREITMLRAYFGDRIAEYDAWSAAYDRYDNRPGN